MTLYGTMVWFNQAKDFGVLASEGGERLRVAGDDFAGGERPARRCAGAAVTFAVAEDVDGRKATDVRLVPETVPRRARLRHARYRSGG